MTNLEDYTILEIEGAKTIQIENRFTAINAWGNSDWDDYAKLAEIEEPKEDREKRLVIIEVK